MSRKHCIIENEADLRELIKIAIDPVIKYMLILNICTCILVVIITTKLCGAW